MKKFLLALLLAVSILSPSFARAKGPERDQKIVIIYTNDVHCGVDDHIGYAGLVAYKNQMLKETPYVTMVDAGDAVQGDITGTLSKGKDIITIMNSAGYDVAIPGNHEFDYGMAALKSFAKDISCGYISANLRSTETGKLLFPPYKIIRYGKTKVAFVGVTTPESVISSNPLSFMNDKNEYIYTFGGEHKGEPMFRDVQNAIDQARKEGADYVVLIAHLGERDKGDGWNSINLVANIQGADVLIDGHTHSVIPKLMTKDKSGREIAITQSGTKLAHIGKVTIFPDGRITTELIDKAPEEPDQKTAELINSIKGKYLEYISRTVGTSEFPMVATDDKGTWLVRTGETNLGDFFADAMRDTLDADIALVNGGGLRTTLPAGIIRYSDVLKVFPFGNPACTIMVKGKDIVDELEFGARLLPVKFGGLLQVSGLSYSVDISIPSSAGMDEEGFFTGVTGPYRVKDVKVNGKPIDLEKNYKVADSGFLLLNHGDGHRFDGALALPNESISDCDAVVRYIEKLGKIPAEYADSKGQGRIIIK